MPSLRSFPPSVPRWCAPDRKRHRGLADSGNKMAAPGEARAARGRVALRGNAVLTRCSVGSLFAGRRLRLVVALLLLVGSQALAPSHHLTARDLARLRAALERPFADLQAAYHSIVGLHSLGLSVADEKVGVRCTMGLGGAVREKPFLRWAVQRKQRSRVLFSVRATPCVSAMPE